MGLELKGELHALRAEGLGFKFHGVHVFFEGV